MAEPQSPSEAVRGSRGQSIHSGATDLGLLAPTPLALGVAGALALPGIADAQPAGTAGGVADRVGGEAQHGGSPSGSDIDPAGLVSVSLAPGNGAVPPDIAGSPVVAAHSVAITESGNAAGFGGGAPVAVVSFMPAAPAAALPTADPAPVEASPAAAEAPAVSDAVTAVQASAEILAGAIQSLVSQVAAAAPADTAARPQTSLEGIAAETVTGAAAGVGTLVESLDALAANARSAAGDLISNTVQTAGGLVADTAAGAGDLVSDVGMAAADLTAGVSNHVGDVLASADDTVDAVLDATPLGGVDPDGGIATLANMLEDADGFVVASDLSETAAPIFASTGGITAALEDTIDIVPAVLPDLGMPSDGGGDGPGLLGLGQHGLSHNGLGGLFDDDGVAHG